MTSEKKEDLHPEKSAPADTLKTHINSAKSALYSPNTKWWKKLLNEIYQPELESKDITISMMADKSYLTIDKNKICIKKDGNGLPEICVHIIAWITTTIFSILILWNFYLGPYLAIVLDLIFFTKFGYPEINRLIFPRVTTIDFLNKKIAFSGITKNVLYINYSNAKIVKADVTNYSISRIRDTALNIIVDHKQWNIRGGYTSSTKHEYNQEAVFLANYINSKLEQSNQRCLAL